jgi:hypothetical protein
VSISLNFSGNLRWRGVTTLVCGWVLSFLGGCGGGGGPGPLQDNTVSASFSVAEVKATVIEGDPAEPLLNVVATIKYSGSRDIFLGSNEDQGLLSDYGIYITQPTVAINLRFKGGRAAGTYNSQLKLRACFDQACREEAPGSPMLLPLQLVVTPNLQVQPTLELARTGREAAPVGTVTVTVPPNAGTLSLSNSNALYPGFDVQLQGNVLKVNTQQVRAGRYTGRVEFVASGSPVYRAGVDIAYTVNPPPGGELPLALVATDSGPSAVEQGLVFKSRFRVQRPTWIEDKSAPVLTDSSGLTSLRDLGGDEFELTLDTAGIATGTYFSPQINIVAGPLVGQTNLGWFFQVSDAFTVYAGLSVSLNGSTTPDDLRLKAPILSTGGQPLRWTARSLTPWVRLLRTSGMTGQDQIEVELDAVQVLSTAASKDGGQIEVSVDRPGTLPVTVGVGVGNNIPRVGPAMRGALLPGSATVYVDGNHPGVDACMKLSGATLRRFTSAEDTRFVGRANVLRVDLDNAVVGQDVVVRCVTPLLTSELRVPVRAAPRVPSGYAALPFATWRSAQFAMTRNALFFASPGTLVRWSLANGAWTLRTSSMPGVADAALYGDETFLIGVGDAGAWRIGAESLAIEAGPVVPGDSFRRIGFEPQPLTGMSTIAFAADGAVTVASRHNLQLQSQAYGPFGASGLLAPLTGSFANGTDPGSLLAIGESSGPPLTSGVVRSPGGSTVVGVNFEGRLRDYQPALRYPLLPAPLPAGLSLRAISEDGTRRVRSDGVLQVNGTAAAGSWATRLPAGFIVGGYGLTGKGDHALVYGYRIASESTGPRARDAAVWLFDVSQAQSQGIAAAPLLERLSLPDAVGCTGVLQASETCEHVATVTVAEGDQSAFVLGPRGVAALPLPVALAATLATKVKPAVSQTSTKTGVIRAKRVQ